MANRHCHHCGTPYLPEGHPGRSETCEKCRGDLKVCLNCTHYDPGVAYQCRERRSEPVAEKAAANFCEFFEFVLRDWQPGAVDAREAAARARLRQLFGE